MSNNEQLDAVLFYIRDISTLNFMVNRGSIKLHLDNEHGNLKVSELLLNDILIKLHNDGYLNSPSQGIYNVSIEGRDFKGYVYSNKWFRTVSRKTIIEGVIYGGILAVILWAVAKVYNVIFCK
jgi:hypothetical protein